MKSTQLFHRIVAVNRHPLIAFLASADSTGLKGKVCRRSRWLGMAAILCCLANPLMAAKFGRFTYTDDGTSITITGYTDDGGDVGIPSSIRGKPVTGIGDKAFRYSWGLTAVTIPNSVISIGKESFLGCSQLTNVMLGNGVTSIGENAFSNCGKLTAITVDSRNPAFSSSAGVLFNKNKTQLIRFPGGGGGGGNYVVPDGVTSIGAFAFMGCNCVTSITISYSVTSIGDEAFSDCDYLSILVDSRNPTFSSASGILFNKIQTQLIRCPGAAPQGSWRTYTVPASVTSIGNKAFKDCDLWSIKLPDSVTSIGEGAFSNCMYLASINIPNGVTNIGDYVFYGCRSLTSITIPDSATGVGDAAFEFCGLTDVRIGNGVTRIGDRAFRLCTSLTGVTIPANVASIGDAAFQECFDLADVMIGSSVTTIGDRAFDKCRSLARVTIPDSVTSSGDRAFNGCQSLTGITIGQGVTNIGDRAFSGCHSLAAITVDPLNSCYSSESGILFNKDKTLLIRYPQAESGSFSIPTSVTNIEVGAFAGSRLANINIHNGVTNIGDWAFSSCRYLTSITISDRIRSIGNGTFRHCHRLTTVTIPNGVTSLGNESFAFCDRLKTITIPDSVTNIGHSAFQYCGKLTSVILPIGVTRIGRCAFSDCGSLDRVIFLGNAPTVGAQVFGRRRGFIVFFPAERTGFTTPTWKGYTSVPLRAKREISVAGPAGSDLRDGGTGVDFGSIGRGESLVRTFTITNAGCTKLSGLAISKTGSNANNFTVKAPHLTSLTTGTSTTFEVIFKPSARGIRKAVIHIKSNDSNENPFDITLTGKGMGFASQSNVGLPEFALSAPGISGNFNAGIRSVTSMLRIDGNKYRCITIIRNGTTDPDRETVEVSSNLVDWFSGPKHTTVIEDSPELLKVRDITPIEPGKKRFIRAR